MALVRVIFFTGRLFGFRNFEFSETESGYVARPSRVGISCCVLNVALYAYFSYENMRTLCSYASTGSDVVDIGSKIILGLGMADMMFVLVRWLIQNRWNVGLLNAFRSIDAQLAAMGISHDNDRRDRELLANWLLLAALTVSALVYSLYTAYRLGDALQRIPIFVGHLFISSASGVIGGLFIGQVTFSRCKVRAINEHLSQKLCDEDLTELRPTFGRKKIKVDSPAAASLRRKLVAGVALAYDDIHSVTIDISHRCKTEFTGFCLVTVLYGIMALYTFYRAIFKTDPNRRFSTSIFLSWAIVYTINLLQIVSNCHLLALEGKKTAAIIGYAAAQENDLMCNKKMHSFLCQLRQTPIKITTYYFDVNLNVFFAIISTVATYLFILIQFAG